MEGSQAWTPGPPSLGLGLPCPISLSPGKEGGLLSLLLWAGGRRHLPWSGLSTCSEGLGPGQKCTPSLGALLGAYGEAHGPWLSGCHWATRSQGRGRHLHPHPLTYSFSLRGPIFPYMVKAVPREGGGVGGDKGRSPAASLPQLPEISQVAAASSSQVRQPCGNARGP